MQTLTHVDGCTHTRTHTHTYTHTHKHKGINTHTHAAAYTHIGTHSLVLTEKLGGPGDEASTHKHTMYIDQILKKERSEDIVRDFLVL